MTPTPTPGVRYDPRLKPLLEEAALAYRRHDDAAFRTLLGEATERAPHRLDLWFNLANHHIQTGSPETALDIFHELSGVVPEDADGLLHLAHWLLFAGRTEEAFETLSRLRTIRPEKAADLERIWRILGEWLSRPVGDELPDFASLESPVALVALGYRLEPDGSMHRILIERLEKTLEAAARCPAAVVIVTGGVPRAGRVEATEMRRWLLEKGVDPDRVWEEGYARDVVENLLYSRQILSVGGMRSAVCLTSAIDVRRAGAGMEIAAWSGGDALTVAATAASGSSCADFQDDGRDRLKLFRDALRAYGIPMQRTFPELTEL